MADASRPLPALLMPRNIWKVTFSRVVVKKEITKFAFHSDKRKPGRSVFIYRINRRANGRDNTF